ncbi:NAD+ synthase [Pseudogemmatithrix spongiicola]|uniref:NH(3)-dependent NAD(+) synthetase n=1 Tax=Pseudogemmatithrix spongiicola TaxID=3062599 RepID=A0AA49Q5K7_9BACT|nr:NAD+ synthase [Gemmatimonadaceae bacterium 'strain 138']WKW16240.1 NAD+ synthase [Gemmatimonadaceae bacterium 'strain 318']
MSTLTIALPQFRPAKANLPANLDRIAGLIAQSVTLEPRPQLVVFAETVTTGYFVEGGVRELALPSERLMAELASRLASLAPKLPAMDVVLGFYEVAPDGTLHNSAACVSFGGGEPARLLHLHRKNFLPTYGLFDEERFVERGYGVEAFDTRWGRAAILICEDAWHSLTGTIAALDGAQVVCVVAAAPARGIAPRDEGSQPGSVGRWERLIRDIADEHGVYAVLANLVGSEGGRMFQGGSMVVGPRGDVRVRGPVFEEALVTATVELADLARVRAELPLLSDLKSQLPYLRTELDRVLGLGERRGGEERKAPRGESLASPKAAAAATAPRDVPLAAVNHLPLVTGSSHAAPPSLDIDARLVEQWLVAFLRDEFQRRGFSKAVVGVSGGVDSAVVAALAARALGKENVIGVRLPYRSSSADSLAHAQLLMDQLGIEQRTLDITGAVDGYLAQEPDADAARRGNVMARVRMISLFDLSAKHRALPLGTGNKSERLLGYFTWHADDSPPVNPIGDLFKTQVWQLAAYLGVPSEIVQKPASADLIAGQTDEADFGVSYAVADEILNWLLHGWTREELLAKGIDGEALRLVTKRLDSTHWKRKLPTVAMLSAAAIGESYLRPVDY